MKVTFCALCLFMAGFALSEPSQEPEFFPISEEFVAYMKTTTNPHEFGLRADGKFYPYSTPRGRRIGYDQPITNKSLFRTGCLKIEAEEELRARLKEALEKLKMHIAENYPEFPFRTLSRKSQEMLLDFAFSEGATNISPAFYDTVLREDWGRLFDSFIYIRWIEKGWPNTAKNKAFADRWLNPKERLRPGSAVWPDPDPR